MKGFLKFLLFIGFVAGVVYVVKNVLGGQPAKSGAGAGVLPDTPITPLEEILLTHYIRAELLEILVDPQDKGKLELVEAGKFLLNPRNGYRYPIRDGIPVMLIDEGKKHQDKSLAGANGNGIPAKATA